MKLTKMYKEAIVRAIFADMPEVDIQKRSDEIKAAIVEAMSPEVREIYKAKPHALRSRYVDYANPFSGRGGDTIIGDVDDATINKIVAPYRAQQEERRIAKQKLESAFEGISTLKQALAAFPEFEKYFPKDAEVTKNLPALANVVTDLVRLGWPTRPNNAAEGAV